MILKDFTKQSLQAETARVQYLAYRFGSSVNLNRYQMVDAKGSYETYILKGLVQEKKQV